MSATSSAKSPATFLAILPIRHTLWLTPRGIKKNSSPAVNIFSPSPAVAPATPSARACLTPARARFQIPLGTVYSTNLTSDNETGLGSWTDQQIIDAVTKGLRKDGSRQLPLMPYTLYSGMAQEDLKALVAYLRSLKPVKKATPELKTSTPFMRSVVTEVWLKAFGTFYESPAQAPKSGIQRGKYLTNHVAICGDCHTPRNSFGVPNQSLDLAGSPKDGPIGERVPNITPDKETGIGDWKREEIAELLLTGVKPDFDNVQGLMEEVIRGTTHGYKDMTKEDALAIADYLKSIPAIKNVIK